MGVMSLFQFTKSNSDGTNMTLNKIKRNRMYRICGRVIFGSLGAAFPVLLIPSVREGTEGFRLLYWLESLMIRAFGISWLVKGEALLAD